MEQCTYLINKLIYYIRDDVNSTRSWYSSYFLLLKNTLETNGFQLKGLKILDIGCSRRFSESLLLNSLCADVTAIDRVYVDPGFSLFGFFKVLKKDGFAEFVKDVIRHILFDRRFYKLLSKLSGLSLKFDGINVKRMDASRIDFPDESFDFICSNACFEHIIDIENAVFDMYRILRPAGMAVIRAHLFPSISGGHNSNWPNLLLWGHLRQGSYPVYHLLNRKRDGDYRLLFSKFFTIIDVKYEYAGDNYLTNELEQELLNKGYSKDELLKEHATFILKKNA